MVTQRRNSHARTTATAVDVRKLLCLAKTSQPTCHVSCLPRMDSDGEKVWFNAQPRSIKDATSMVCSETTATET